MAQNTVVAAINAVSTNARVRLAMLMGAFLESGWNPNAVGDSGNSHGAFQIHLPAHPNVTASQAKDPQFAAQYMLKAYEAGVNRVDPALWNSNPATAAATAAFYAERPKVMYPADRISKAWPTVNSAWSGGSVGAATDSLVNDTQDGSGLDAVWNMISWWLYDTFGSLVDYVYFGLLYAAGGITIATGFYLIFKESSRVVPTAKAVGQGYRTVLGKG